ncbi:MAG: DUF1064 domain-containing protein [Chlamydiia bacterium]|nr:DUF1064 domain-containing protein [Chlamydiia bacterium]
MEPIYINGTKKNTKTYNKYNRTRSTDPSSGMTFDSILEMKCYKFFEYLKNINQIKFFLTQVPLRLPGKVKLILDFLVFLNDGSTIFFDAKGFETKEFIIKRKIAEDIYPITINLLKKSFKQSILKMISYNMVNIDE